MTSILNPFIHAGALSLHGEADAAVLAAAARRPPAAQLRRRRRLPHGHHAALPRVQGRPGAAY